MNRIITLTLSLLIFLAIPSTHVSAQNDCNCWQQRDTSFHPVPFAYDSDGSYIPNGPYYRCDDGVTNAITLPFSFCYWGVPKNTVYINTNGSISFDQQYSSFHPTALDSFPMTNYEMIAPFWADVDTRNVRFPGSDIVLYKITPHYMIVQWDSVGYYNLHIDKLNSFQLIISDGTDPIIPKGNTVEFCYRNMNWTSGDASFGIGGFGGYPATVGANESDAIRYIQMGLFASPGTNYVGQFPPGPNYDGVGWLTNKSFLFNLCRGSIAPLTSGISPCDTFRICLGDSLFIPIYFLSPIEGDSVWSNLAPPVPPGVSVVSNRPGPTDSILIRVVGSAANLGYHTVNVYGYDNQLPPDTTYTSFVIEVDTAPKVNISAFRDTICVGDTSVLSAGGAKLYLWNTGATTSSIKVAPTVTTTYTLGVSDGGCNKDTTIQVVVLPTPLAKLIAKPDTICPKDSVLLIASGGGTYKWNTGKTNDSIWVKPLINTTYTIHVSNGVCADSAVIQVHVTTPGSSSVKMAKDSICPFDADTLVATGGTVYKWSTGATTSSIIVSPGTTTTYTLISTVTCSIDTIKQKVVVTPLPVPVIKGRLAVCKGQGDTINISGGTTYLWSNGSTKTYYILKNIYADSTITVQLFNGRCYRDTTIHITIKTPPYVTVNPPALACAGSPVLLQVSDTGTGPFTYLWRPGNRTTDTITVYDSAKTTYTVYVSNGCTSSKVTTVTPDSPPLSACCDAQIIKGSDTTISAYGKGIIKYTWTDSSTLVCLDPPLCKDMKATPTVTTTYTVVGMDSLGCEVERFVTIVVDIPCFDFNIPNVFTPNFAGQMGANGGTNNVFYIHTKNLSAWSILVYDRWGKEMFKSTDPYKYWDGNTEGGSKAPDGVYYYIITSTCQGTTYNKHGFVQLIR